MLPNKPLFDIIKKYDTSNFTIGVGIAMGHHGEVIQGAIEYPQEGVKHFLVTLPCSNIKSHSRFVPIRNSSLFIEPFWKTKSYKAAGLTLDYLGINGYGGLLQVHSETSPELGFGSSTSDVVAAIRAVANAFKRTLKPSEISSIAVEAESACDPIMFDDQVVVFCQREGIVMESLVNQLPRASVVGFNTSGSGGGISTLDFPLPEYDRQEIGAFQLLLEELRMAVSAQSIQLLGKVATASARINQRFLPKPNFDALLEILNESGACGFQVAHSGNIAGFLFDPNDANLANRHFKVRHALIRLGIKDIWHFNIQGNLITI